MSQQRLPIVEMLERFRATAPVELCCPGHRGGRGVDADVLALLGAGAFAADVTQLPDIDDLHAPGGAIAEAQALAAEVWGARDTFFLVNGTTIGIHAALLATCAAGDVVAVPRASHRSVLGGMILSGAAPRWIPCGVDPLLGCALPPEATACREAATGARVLVLTRPTYHGDAAELPPMEFLEACGTILVVDEAWGAHLGFHPETPASACRVGADVVVNSTHKTLTALSGGSMLHRVSGRVERERLAAAVGLLTTTSPWYGALAALDGARRRMATAGRGLVDEALRLARGARQALRAREGIEVAGVERAGRLPGVAGYDETRIALTAAGMGWTGYELERELRARQQVCLELADAVSVVALVGPGDGDAVERLVRGVRRLGRGSGRAPAARAFPIPDAAMTPRESFLAPSASIPAERAVGRISAEIICPYPPGIPAVCPGEVITRDLLDGLRELRDAGGRLQGGADPRLEFVRVVA